MQGPTRARRRHPVGWDAELCNGKDEQDHLCGVICFSSPFRQQTGGQCQVGQQVTRAKDYILRLGRSTVKKNRSCTLKAIALAGLRDENQAFCGSPARTGIIVTCEDGELALKRTLAEEQIEHRLRNRKERRRAPKRYCVSNISMEHQ